MRSAAMEMRGIYTLILELDRSLRIEVGSLGKILFREGYYAYTGSARGPGGFKRIKRHISVIIGENSTRRWHIDYILPYLDLRDVITTTTEHDLECAVAGMIGAKCIPVPHFGCTDCRCLSHLHYSSNYLLMLSACKEAHKAISSGDE